MNRVLIVSAYHGGSHRSWAEGYRRASRHEVTLLTLPARFWKWRMHGGAVTLARRFVDGVTSGRLAMPDLLLFTDMVDMTTFLALTRRSCPTIPAVLYMHENQLTYPLPGSADTGPMRRQKGERDLHYAFVNYASMLAADRVYFNSSFHRDELLNALRGYLRHFPEFNELGSIPALADKSRVLPVGIDGPYFDEHRPPALQSAPSSTSSPLLIWNQRWEFDKNPKQFFEVANQLANEGLEFQLAVCGERFSRQPPEFLTARETLADRIVHWGFAERKAYARLLWQATVTASTAWHEFFGISIFEAMYCGTFAVLPNRLSYPELLPEIFHHECLYDDTLQLLDRLRWALTNPAQARQAGKRLAGAAGAYDWRQVAPKYDAEFEGLSF